MIDAVIDRAVSRQKGAARRPPLFLDDLPANGTERGRSPLPLIASIRPAVFGRRSAFSLAGDGSLTRPQQLQHSIGAPASRFFCTTYTFCLVCALCSTLSIWQVNTHTENEEI